MLDFSFSETQERLRQEVRAFALQELLPRYQEWDRTEQVPADLIRRMGQQGYLVTTVPASYGGPGTDRVTCGLIAEELARGDFNLAILAFGTLVDAFLAYGTERQRREWLPALARGDRILGIALTEPQGGSDAAHLKTTALRRGDEYIVTGEKASVSLLNASGWFLLARTNPDEPGARGISLFILPRDAPGVTLRPERSLGGRALPRGEMILKDVRLPVANRLGPENQGFGIIMEAFDYNRALIGLKCLGAAQQTLEETIAFGRERRAFGRPITAFEAVSFSIAEAATYIELGRWLCYRVLWLRDQGRPHRQEAAMAKWWLPKTCVDIIHRCLLIHGQLGYSDRHPLQQRLRDVMGWQIGDGTAEIQKLIIAREIIGRESVG
ncbi:MAG: acyl-CoA dehydrogenase family protein [Anaerolineae bacterium]